jgi:hypothetical protein
MSETYSFECVVLYFVVFLRQVATEHFVDLTPLGIFFNFNDFWLKQCLKEKIGKFMERKECNAEGKTSACQIHWEKCRRHTDIL